MAEVIWVNPAAQAPSDRKAPGLNRQFVRVASEQSPPLSAPAPPGHPIVPAGWVVQMGDEGEMDTMLLVNGQYRANFTQTVVPYYSGGWPPDPQIGQPGHTPPTQ